MPPREPRVTVDDVPDATPPYLEGVIDATFAELGWDYAELERVA